MCLPICSCCSCAIEWKCALAPTPRSFFLYLSLRRTFIKELANQRKYSRAILFFFVEAMDGLCVSLWLFQREKNKKGSDLYCSVMSVKPEGGNSQVLENIFIKKKETKACSSQAGWLFFFVPSVVVSWCIPPSKKRRKMGLLLPSQKRCLLHCGYSTGFILQWMYTYTTPLFHINLSPPCGTLL